MEAVQLELPGLAELLGETIQIVIVCDGPPTANPRSLWWTVWTVEELIAYRRLGRTHSRNGRIIPDEGHLEVRVRRDYLHNPLISEEMRTRGWHVIRGNDSAVRRNQHTLGQWRDLYGPYTA